MAPVICRTCSNYNGSSYNNISLVCAIHPYGNGESCPDFVERPSQPAGVGELLLDTEIRKLYSEYRDALNNAPSGHCFQDQALIDFLVKTSQGDRKDMTLKEAAIAVLNAWIHTIVSYTNFQETESGKPSDRRNLSDVLPTN